MLTRESPGLIGDVSSLASNGLRAVRTRLELLTIELKDTARAYDPREAPAPQFDLPIEERTPGGLGVHIVKSIMDTIDYRRERGQNIVTMTKNLKQR